MNNMNNFYDNFNEFLNSGKVNRGTVTIRDLNKMGKIHTTYLLRDAFKDLGCVLDAYLYVGYLTFWALGEKMPMVRNWCDNNDLFFEAVQKLYKHVKELDNINFDGSVLTQNDNYGENVDTMIDDDLDTVRYFIRFEYGDILDKGQELLKYESKADKRKDHTYTRQGRYWGGITDGDI